MTETSTQKEKPDCFAGDLPEDADESSGGLDDRDQRFYEAISAGLNRIQISPKRETVLKIINYSRKR